MPHPHPTSPRQHPATPTAQTLAAYLAIYVIVLYIIYDWNIIKTWQSMTKGPPQNINFDYRSNFSLALLYISSLPFENYI